MIYPADTPAFHGAPRRHRGWMVMPHAVERFRSRVANVRHDEATAWLTEHAHEAINTGQRTLRGDRIYRLAHPWPGPDAAFVVKVDPDHTRVVVTCGWWDELATDDDTPATRDDLPEARRGLQPRHARTTLEERVAVILDAPRPPDGLPCPPGSLDLSAILPGYSLDTDALSRADLARWVDYARLVKIHLANSGHGTAAALAKQVESSLRQCAHERLILEQKAAAMRARHNLRAAPPRGPHRRERRCRPPAARGPVRRAAGRVRRLRVRGAASRSRAACGAARPLDGWEQGDAMNLAFDGPLYELIPRLWIGGAPRSTRDSGLIVDFLVMAAREYTPALAGLSDLGNVLCVGLDDDGHTAPNASEIGAIRAVLSAVRMHHGAGRVVALTCLAGKNRSALIGALYLVERGMPNQDALDMTYRARQSVRGAGPALVNSGYRQTVLTWIPTTPRRVG